MTDYGFVMAGTKEHILLTIIGMPPETAVRVGFLEDRISRVLLIGKNPVDGTAMPLAALLGRDASVIESLGNGIGAVSCKAGCKDTSSRSRIGFTALSTI